MMSATAVTTRPPKGRLFFAGGAKPSKLVVPASPYTIRPAVLADVPAMAALNTQGIGPQDYRAEVQQTIKDMIPLVGVAPQQARAVVATIGHPPVVVATATYEALTPQQAVVDYVFVDPAHRLQGLGRQLMANLTASAQKAGLRELTLTPTDEAFLCIQKWGFRPTQCLILMIHSCHNLLCAKTYWDKSPTLSVPSTL
jgi:GNAT superfamily N-acetyltransferase